MSRYIDAIPLIEKWEKECGRGTNNGTCQGDCFDCQFPAAIDDLKDAPTVDAVPVEFIETLKNNFPNDSVGVFAIDYILMMYRNFGKEQTNDRMDQVQREAAGADSSKQPRL